MVLNVIIVGNSDTLQEIVMNQIQDNNVIVAMKKVMLLENAQKEIVKPIWSAIDAIKLDISQENAKVKLN